jgi:hypothetical protein
MQTEERNIGAVDFEVYKQYFRSGNGAVLLPAMILALILMQASMIISTYWCVIALLYNMTWEMLMTINVDRLVWWQERCVCP